jgi:hypothetical protein
MYFVVNGCEYDQYYLLIDGIYQERPYFIQSTVSTYHLMRSEASQDQGIHLEIAIPGSLVPDMWYLVGQVFTRF